MPSRAALFSLESGARLARCGRRGPRETKKALTNRPSVAALLVACLALVGCPPAGSQQAVRPGGVAGQSAGQTDFDRALALYQQGRFAEAAQAFQDFPARHPGSPLDREAEFRRGEALNRLGRYREARAVLQDFLSRYPNSGRSQEAAVELALAEDKLGHAQEAQQILEPAVQQLTPQQRQEMAPALAEEGQGGSLVLQAIAQAAVAAESGDVQAKERLFDLVDTQATFVDLATVYAQGPSAPAYGLVAAKMARVYLHLGDPARAEEAAQAALAHGAGGMSAAVQQTLARLELRRRVAPAMVGVVLPLSGPFQAWGKAIRDGVDLALGPKSGVQVVYEDSRGDPLAAASAVEDLAGKGAIAVLGPVGEAESRSAAVRAEELGVPLVSLSRAEGLTGLGPYVFRDSLTNSEQGRALAKYVLTALKSKAAAVLAPDIPSSDEVTGAFWRTMVDGGGEIRGYESYLAHATMFTQPIERLVARDHVQDRPEFKAAAAKIVRTQKNPYWRRRLLEKLMEQQPPVVDFDALLIPDYYKTIGLVAPALAVENVVTDGCDPRALAEIKKTTKQEDIHPVTLLGTADWDSPELVTRGGRYVMCSVFVDGFYAQSDRPATKKFVDAFQERYQRVPGLLEAQGYDAAALLRMLVTKERPQTRDELRDDLAKVRDYPGATGDTTIAPDREADKPLFFLTVDSTGIRELDVDISPFGLAAQPVPAPAPATGAKAGP